MRTGRSIPRAHHFAPQTWLAGFTDSGQKEGRLWVTDLKKGKQWQSNPTKAGHRRDFYRIGNPDPFAAETGFSEIEDEVAPILKSLYEKPREPRGNDLKVLLIFAALQYVRVPAFRPAVLKIADSLHRGWMAEAIKTPETWRKALKKAGIPVDSPGASYEDVLKFEREVIDKGQYSLSAGNDWYLMRGFSAVQRSIIPAFNARYWKASISPSGRFISSDNPVSMDGPPGQLVGFKNAEIIMFPVNRHVLLYGTQVPGRLPAATLKTISKENTLTMLTANEHIYSHEPDFSWLDEKGACQTDWRLFSKENLEKCFLTVESTAE